MQRKILVMGVAGAGKSTLARALAARLGLAFIEGDDLHSPANRTKMAADEPLTDEDRAPWLTACRAALAGGGVLACSALTSPYRAMLGPDVRVIWLDAGEDVLRARLAAREGHFFPASLLASQLATLEPPGPEALHLRADQPLAVLLDQAAAWLAS
jgi:gluconokinase